MVCLRTRMPVSIIPNEQLRRDLLTSEFVRTTLSQNTKDILNILTGRLLENEQDGEPVIMRDEEKI